MPLKSFDDYMHNMEETNQRMESIDSKGAKKQLLKSFEKHKDKQYISKRHLIEDIGEDKLVIATGDEKGIVVRVLGFYGGQIG